MGWVLAGLIVMVAPSAWAADPGDCPSPASLQTEKSIPVDGSISWFMRAATQTREVSFATAKNGSQILNLDSGQTSPIAGSIDPVLSADGKILAIPQNAIWDGKAAQLDRSSSGKNPYEYVLSDGKVRDNRTGTVLDISLEDAKRQGKRIKLDSAMALYTRPKSGAPQVALIDTAVTGNYQSMGTFRKAGDETHYRMLYEGDAGFRMREYKLNESSGKVEAVGLDRAACRGNEHGALPIVSHDGREFSYYDIDDRNTKIVALDDNGDCKVVDKIPALIGKPDFSPDGNRLVFHVDEALEGKNMEFEQPDKDQKLGIYLYDRKTKALAPLRADSDSNSYYPTFISDNQIAYIQSRGTGDEQKMSVEVARLGRSSGTICRACDENPKLAFAGAVVGFIYARYCGGKLPNLGTANTALSRLTPAVCRKVTASLDQARIDQTRERLAGNLSWDVTALTSFQDDPLVKNIRPRQTPPKVSKADLDEICNRLSVEVISGPDVRSSH